MNTRPELTADGGARRHGESMLGVATPATLGLTPSASADAGRVLRVETTVNASAAAVWQVWTTPEGAQTFFAPKANIELRPGGAYEIFFNPADERMSTKGRKVLSYETRQILSFEWNLPLDEFPDQQTQRTWVVVTLQPTAASRTRVTITQLGLAEGPAWERAYAHMERGWRDLASRLQSRFEHGPIDWSSQAMMWKERMAK